MSLTSHHFTVGKLQCVAVSDGSSFYEAGLLFANAPEDELRQVLEAYALGPGEMDIPYTCLAVNMEESWLLIDAGQGTRNQPGEAKLLKNLRKEGIDPADIGTVVLTHGHGDHDGGITDEQGQLVFPKARYIMAKAEWDFWTTEENLIERGRMLLPIQEKVELVEQEKEIEAGVRVVPVVGHTPGHMVVAISSGGEELWSTGDALIHPIHLERLEWYTVFDLEPERSLAARQWVLNEVSSRGAWVHAFHFPFPGIGRVIREEGTWRWQPVGIG